MGTKVKMTGAPTGEWPNIPEGPYKLRITEVKEDPDRALIRARLVVTDGDMAGVGVPHAWSYVNEAALRMGLETDLYNLGLFEGTDYGPGFELDLDQAVLALEDLDCEGRIHTEEYQGTPRSRLTQASLRPAGAGPVSQERQVKAPAKAGLGGAKATPAAAPAPAPKPRARF